MSTPLAALGNRTPEQLKVAELREELRKRGIQIKGLKKDLVDRLEDVLRQEELEQQNTLAAEDAPAAAAPIEQPEPVTPGKKRRSKGQDHLAKDAVAAEPAEVVAAEPAEVVAAPAEGDIVSQSVSESLPGASETAAEPLPDTIVLSVPAEEEAKAPEMVKPAPPALEDLVADLERLEDPNYNKVEAPAGGEMVAAVVAEKSVEENVASTTLELTVTTSVEEQVVAVVSDQNVVTVQEEQVVTTSTKVATMEETAGEVVTTEDTTTTVATVEKTTTVVADGEGLTEAVKLLEDTTGEGVTEAVKLLEDTTGEGVTEAVKLLEDTTGEGVTEAVKLLEDTTGEGATEAVKLLEDTTGEGVTEAVKLLEDKTDEAMGEVSKEEDVVTVVNDVSVAETPKDETLMDVDAGAEKETVLETPKEEVAAAADVVDGKELEKPVEETPMDVDADAQKGSKRKDADGELVTLEPTKRRRWNSAKDEGDLKGPGKDVPSVDVQEPVPAATASVPPAKVQTPKSAPPEKVAVTRTAPTRAEATVNGESQKTRVVPPSANPATTSLKIDKFLRPFTFKAVKELLAQTGTVEDVWMDQIKTHCYVTYSSVEEATATRNALYNLQWPPQGGRLLTAEFVEASEVKLRSDGEKAAAAAGPTATAPPPTNAITPRGGNATNLKASKDGSVAPSSSHPSTPAAAALPPPPPLPFPPRDRSKQEVEKTPTLDDLFRKTRSKPHIYYLPLTAEEVAAKVAARNREAAAKPGVKA